MKKSIWAIVVLILATSLCACGKTSQHDIYKEIYKRYSQMTSFYATANVTVETGSIKSVYSIRQFYQAPDKIALFIDSPEEVSGSGYIASDGKFLLKSGFGQTARIPLAFPDKKNILFLNDFFEEYFKSEESVSEASSSPLAKTTVLTCFLPDGSDTEFMQRLTLDSKTCLPLILETCDINQKPVIKAEFTDFKRNCDIDQRIFN